jgi:hypothetical protein
MRLLTILKRFFLVSPEATALEKRGPHKLVRTKAQAAQKRMSDLAAKEGGRSKIQSAPKSRPKRGK